jgi:predicted N-acyltransferase
MFINLYSIEGFLCVMKELGYEFTEDKVETHRLIFIDLNIVDSVLPKANVQFHYTNFGHKDLQDILNLVSARNDSSSRALEREKMQQQVRFLLGIQ